MGLAAASAPGSVTGIDASSSEVDVATERAGALGVENIGFRPGDIYNIPSVEGAYDAVLVHAVLHQLADPAQALREVRRVLRPGGFVGVRDLVVDVQHVTGPCSSSLPRWMAEQSKMHQTAVGGSPWAGQHLRRLLREAGFDRAEGSASYESYGDGEAVA